MDGNQLSFGISARNNATTALNSLQNQVTSLKNGLQSLGNTKVDTTSTTRFLNSLNSNVSKTSKGLGSLAKSVTSTIATFGGFKLVNSMFNTITGTLDRALTRIDTMDLFDQKITMITGSASEATEALEHLKTSTKGTPYALDIAAKAVQNFVTRGMATNKATESVDIWMDAVSAYGKGTNEQFESVLDAIAKMRTKGTVEMRYLNRLFAAGINPVQMYAKATGMAAEDVQTALTKKEIKTDEFLSVVETAMREGTNGVIKVAGKAKDLATTWAATLANMQTAIARGWAEFIKGADTLFTIFDEDGIKGLFKNYGNAVEDALTGAGKAITTVMNRLKAGYQAVRDINVELFDRGSRTMSQNAEAIQRNLKSAKDTFNGNFTAGMVPYLEDIMTKFEQIRVSWSRVKLAFSQGLEQISAPLARLASEYLGTTVTGVEDLFLAFTKWLTLKLPVFFDKLEEVLNWLIEHKDGVLSAVKSILTGLLAFNALASVKNVIVGFNNSLKSLNDLLAFYSGGRFEIPTLESIAQRSEKKRLAQAAVLPASANAIRSTDNLATNVIDLASVEKTQKIKEKTNKVNTKKVNYNKPLEMADEKLEKKYLVKEIQNKKATLRNSREASKLTPTYLPVNRNRTLTTDKTNFSNSYKRLQYDKRVNDYQALLNKNYKNVAGGKATTVTNVTPLSTNSNVSTIADSLLGVKRLEQENLKRQQDLLGSVYKRVDLSKDSVLTKSTKNIAAVNAPDQYGFLPAHVGFSKLVDGSKSALDKTEAYFKDLGSYIKNSAVATGKGTKEVFAESGALAGRGAVSLGKGIKNKVSNWWDFMNASSTGETFTKEKLANAATSTKNGVIKAGTGLKNTAQKGVDNVAGFFSGALEGFQTFSNLNVKDVGEDLKQVGQATKESSRRGLWDIGNVTGGLLEGFRNLGRKEGEPTLTDRLKNAKDFLLPLNEDKNGNKIFTASNLKELGGSLGRGAKNVATAPVKAGKGLASGAGNFFGTMFSGFGNLGKGANAKVALTGAEEAVTQGNSLTKVLDKLKGGFGAILEPIQAAGSGIMSFISSFGGLAVAVVGSVAAIGALTAGLGLLNPGNALSNGINKFFQSFFNWCSSIAQNAPIIIQDFVKKIQESLPQLSSQGVNLLLSLVNGIMTGIPKLLTAAFTVGWSLITGLLQILPDLVKTGFQAIGQFIAGIIRNLPNISAAAWELIKTVIKTVVSSIPQIMVSGIRLVIGLVQGIWSMVSQVGSAIYDVVTQGIQYLWDHKGEIWDNIKNFCSELANSFYNSLWEAIDSIPGGSKVAEWFGMQRPEAQQAGQEIGNATTDGAMDGINQSGGELHNAWNDIMQQLGIDTTAEQQAGAASGQALVDSTIDEMMAGVDESAMYGADTADAYTQGMADEFAGGSEVLDASLNGLTTDNIATISVNFSSEQVGQAAAGLINTLTGYINDNAFVLYQAIAVLSNNAVTQLAAGFAAVPEEIPNAITTAMTTVVESVRTKVVEICNTIKDNLLSAKDQADTTTKDLSTAISNNFNTAQTSALASLETMKTGVIQKYDELRSTIQNDLTQIETYHDDFATNTMGSLKSSIQTGLDDVRKLYDDFTKDIKSELEDLITYHAGAANNIMTGFIEGLRQRKDEAASVESEIVQTLKDTFEKGLGIASPSRYGTYVGNMFLLGLIRGVKDDKLNRLLNNSISAMQEAFKKGNGAFNADATVNFLSKDAVVNLIGKVGELDTEDAGGDQIAYPLAGGTYPITSYFGLRDQPTEGASTNHGALDIGAPMGTGIRAILGGTVTQAGWNGGYGNSVTISHGNGIESLYGHMSSVGTNVGAKVSKGQGIGQVGSTGVSTGAHLHLGIYQNGTAIDPLPYIEGASLAAVRTLQTELQDAYDKKYNPEAYAARMAGLSGSSGGETQPVENWRATVNQALQMLGLSTDYADGILATMNAESSGNPNSLNDWDSNWVKGTPSKGLMQVIDPTFAAYALPGYNTNIWDPLSNILASIRYQLAAYGDLGAKLSGYAVGTRRVPQDMLAMIHKDEAIIPANQNPYLNSGGDYLADMFSSALGNDLNSVGFNYNSGTSEGSTQSDNQFNFNGNIIFNVTNNNDADGDRFIGNLEAEMTRILQDGFRARGV